MINLHVDVGELVKLENAFRKIGNQAPHAIRRAINHTGDKARTQIVKVLARQVGVPQKAIRAVMLTRRANWSLEYVIDTKGQYISLKHFGARQTRKGVSAAPWGTRRVFPGTFGPRIGKLGGHVYVRTSKARLPIKKLWGPAIPNEMLKGEAAAAFYSTVEANLPARLEHEIGAILSGAAPRG